MKPVDADQLRIGIKVEMEHTDDPKVAEKIARDHLMEIPDYYTRLVKMEEEALRMPEGNIRKRAEELSTAYSYGEIQHLGKEHNLRLSGSKIKMLSQLIRENIL